MLEFIIDLISYDNNRMYCTCNVSIYYGILNRFKWKFSIKIAHFRYIKENMKVQNNIRYRSIIIIITKL